jgi:2-polyprenyl-6-methoxyphenol hydroxylase-like FAD-dependent oxidoreductase
MPTRLGKQAIVIGAGISGLTAAAALADHFDRVVVFERDILPDAASARRGTPQANHPHILLFGGLRALGELFPGVERDLANAGAVRFGSGDMREELPGFDPCFPRRDFGWAGYAMSRPLLELVARRRTLQLPNVALRDNARVTRIVASDDGAVAGIRYQTGDGVDAALSADLVVDASGRGAFALALLEATGHSQPEMTSIGIDINYATTTFSIPKGERDWQLMVTFPDMQSSTKAGYLSPIEGDRWMVLVSERHGRPASQKFNEFLALLAGLRTPTMFDAIRNARPVDRVYRFGFPESCWRHYERLDHLPAGLLAVGDAICRLNPAYGQGMSVATQEARILKDLLREWSAKARPLAGLGPAFMQAVQPLIADAWAQSAIPDFAQPQTRRNRPADIENSFRFRNGLLRLAAADPDVHRLIVGVRHLVEPASALRDPGIVRRVEAEMAEA